MRPPGLRDLKITGKGKKDDKLPSVVWESAVVFRLVGHQKPTGEAGQELIDLVDQAELSAVDEEKWGEEDRSNRSAGLSLPAH